MISKIHDTDENHRLIGMTSQKRDVIPYTIYRGICWAKAQILLILNPVLKDGASQN
jgi:hypothetical protein